MRKNFVKALAATVFLLGASAVANADVNVDQIKLQSALLLPKVHEMKPFTLQVADKSQQGAAQKAAAVKPVNFTNDNLKGHWTLLFFGFTHCPGLCPTTMAQLSAAYKVLATGKYQPMPQVVFVSVDPERDSLAKVTKYATAFNSDFIGARTDDMKTLAQMTRETDAMFEKVQQKTEDNKDTYTINHTGDIAVINPKGEFVGLLRMPHTDKDIVADYKAIVAGLK